MTTFPNATFRKIRPVSSDRSDPPCDLPISSSAFWGTLPEHTRSPKPPAPRGNQGQWVYRDAEDFTKALDLIRKYATLHQVAVHGWCLLHNHGHWIFEVTSAVRQSPNDQSRRLTIL